MLAHPRRSPVVTVVALLASALVIAGIGGCASPSQQAFSSPTVVASPSPDTVSSGALPSTIPQASVSATLPPSGPQTNPADREDVAAGGILRLGVSGFPTSWNPWATSTYDLSVAADVLTPRLFAVGSDGLMVWDSTWLASEPVVEVGEQGTMTVTYSLHPHAQWNDGVAMTPADFQATWLACTTEPGPVCRDRGFEHVIDVSPGVSSSQVVVTYDGVYSDWAHTFARGPSRAEAVADKGIREAGQGSPAGLGAAHSGPYVVVSFDGTTLILARNPSWWGDRPKLDSIWIVATPRESLGLAYLRGNLDGFWVDGVEDDRTGDAGIEQVGVEQGGAEQAGVEQVLGQIPPDPNLVHLNEVLPGIQVRSQAGPTARYLVLNTADRCLTSANVRRALLAGLDRTRLGASDLAGLIKQPSLDSLLWTSEEPGYEFAAEQGYPFDETEAGALLDAEGWPAGASGWRSKDGEELALDFLVRAGDWVGENQAFGVRSQLAALGVRVNLVYAEPTEFAARVAAGEYAMVASAYRHTTSLASAARFAEQGLWGPASFVRATMVSAATARLDQDARTQTLQRLETSMWSQASVLPLYEVPEILLVRSSLANFGPNHLGTTDWEDIGWLG